MSISYKPDPRECALLLLWLISLKEQEGGREYPRLRVSSITLKRLWIRRRLDQRLVEQVTEWLLEAGRVLIDAGSTYAIAKTSAVEGWPRIASKRLSDEIDQVARGKFEFSEIEYLLEVDQPEDENE